MDADESLPSLYEQGWRQGVMFEAPGLSYESVQFSGPNDITAKRGKIVSSKDSLIVISHDCDINSPTEKYIEVLLCRREDPEKDILQKWDKRSSPAYFVVEFSHAWVAVAAHRIKLAKESLVNIQVGTCPMDADRRRQFIEWLSRRYDRPMVSDKIHDLLNKPVDAALARVEQEQPDIWRDFCLALHEIRVILSDIEEIPCRAQFLYVTQEDVSKAHLDAISSINRIMCDSAGEGIYVEEYPEIQSLDQVPYQLIVRSIPYNLDYPSRSDPDSPRPTWELAQRAGRRMN